MLGALCRERRNSFEVAKYDRKDVKHEKGKWIFIVLSILLTVVCMGEAVLSSNEVEYVSGHDQYFRFLVNDE